MDDMSADFEYTTCKISSVYGTHSQVNAPPSSPLTTDMAMSVIFKRGIGSSADL